MRTARPEGGDEMLLRLTGAWRGLAELAIVLDGIQRALAGVAPTPGGAWREDWARARGRPDDSWLCAYA